MHGHQKGKRRTTPTSSLTRYYLSCVAVTVWRQALGPRLLSARQTAQSMPSLPPCIGQRPLVWSGACPTHGCSPSKTSWPWNASQRCRCGACTWIPAHDVENMTQTGARTIMRSALPGCGRYCCSEVWCWSRTCDTAWRMVMRTTKGRGDAVCRTVWNFYSLQLKLDEIRSTRRMLLQPHGLTHSALRV